MSMWGIEMRKREEKAHLAIMAAERDANFVGVNGEATEGRGKAHPSTMNGLQ
jgi:hypothetical protein